MVMQYFTLSNGNKIPAISIIGTGTQWFNAERVKYNPKLVEQLDHALSLPGVVHVDIAENYGTYPELRDALKKTTKPRDQIWITDKFSKYAVNPKAALEESLEIMGIDYVDLYLIHDPFYDEKKPGYDIVQAWKYMEELYKEGKAKNIGVSNWRVEDFEKVLPVAEIKPVVNQIEYSAFLQNQTPGIYDYCKKNGILLEAYGPLGPISQRRGEQGEFYDYIDELAKKYNKNTGLILLRWVYQRGVLPVTTSSKKERITEAITIFDFELEKAEEEKITELGEAHPTVRQFWGVQYSKYDK